MGRSKGANIGEMIGLIIILLIVGFVLISGGIWVICWAFGFTFQWSYVVGALAVGFVFNLLTDKGK